jgi:hypothetical protein
MLLHFTAHSGNASKIQFDHTAIRVFARADGHHARAWILNLVYFQTTSGQ